MLTMTTASAAATAAVISFQTSTLNDSEMQGGCSPLDYAEIKARPFGIHRASRFGAAASRQEQGVLLANSITVAK